MLAIPPSTLEWRRALVFAPEASIDPEWFASFEGSRYGGENSIDAQDVPRPDGSYDFISLSHVLEFVPDDRQAFGELIRVGSEHCIVHVTFASTMNDPHSTHWAEPYGRYGRFHNYGLDVGEWLNAGRFDLTMLVAEVVDSVTGVHEFVHFFTRQSEEEEALRGVCSAAAEAVDEITYSRR